MRAVFIALFFSLNIQSLAEETPLRPRAVSQIGLVSALPAVVFGQGSQILYLRGDRYRLRTDQSHMGEESTRAQVLNNAYLTSIQLKWAGILMELQQEPTNERLVFSPEGYGRASMAGVIDDVESVMAMFDEAKQSTDNKGTGITTSSEDRLTIFMDMFRVLSGKQQLFFDCVSETFQASMLEHIENKAAAVQKLRENQFKGSLEEQTVVRYQLANAEQDLNVVKAYMKGLGERDAQGAVSVETMLEFVQAVSQMDYVNGLFEAARGVREAIVGELIEEVYALLNAQWGTSLGVVPIEYVLALPVQMHSLSYGKQVAAGVLGRAPSYRGHNYYKGDDTSRFWFPKEIVFSLLPGGEQFDVNGHHIDLELITLNVPGIKSYFLPDTHGVRIDRLAVEVTEKALAGDEKAIPDLIAELKSKINRPALLDWAKQNPPPKNLAKDPFYQARQIFNKATSKTLSDSDERVLREALLKMRKAGHTDQLNALMSELFSKAPKVARFFWHDTMNILSAEERKLAKAAAKEKELKPQVRDLRFIGHFVSTLIFESRENHELDDQKFAIAESLFVASPGSYMHLYGTVGAELYRRRMAHHGIHLQGFFGEQHRYQLFLDVTERVCLALMALHTTKQTSIPVTFEDALGVVKYGEKEVDVKEAMAILFGNSREEMVLFVQTLEHLLGLEMPDGVVIQFFPQHMSPQIMGYLTIERRLMSLSTGDRLRCIMEIASQAGLLPDHDPKMVEQAGRLLDFLGGKSGFPLLGNDD